MSRMVLTVATAKTYSLAGTKDEWQRAYRFTLGNALVFLLASLTMTLWDPGSTRVVLGATAVFLVGGVWSFVLLMRSGGVFAALAWFMLGSSVYFGLGVISGGLDPDPRSIHYLSEKVLHEDLVRINLLNSSSVMLVLIGALPFAYAPRVLNRTDDLDRESMIRVLVKTFPLLTLLALSALLMRFATFPLAGSTVVATFQSYFYNLVPFCCLALGVLSSRLRPFWIGLGVFVLLSSFALAVLSMSKYTGMSSLLALVIGAWVHRRSTRSVLLGLLLIGGVYVYVGGFTDRGRLHPSYNADTNSPMERFDILVDTVAGSALNETGNVAGLAEAAQYKAPALVRFSVTAIQGYLMDQYDADDPGTSLRDFWVAAIPRVLWPDKPIVTRVGSDLYDRFWSTSGASSALAPTYPGEAYWNYGMFGVLIVSLLLGVEVGWVTQLWHNAARGKDPAFFVVAFPMVLWATFVENWIVPSYVGGFLTILAIWVIARLAFFQFTGASSDRRRQVPLRPLV